jgi:hypothetical protein
LVRDMDTDPMWPCEQRKDRGRAAASTPIMHIVRTWLWSLSNTQVLQCDVAWSNPAARPPLTPCPQVQRPAGGPPSGGRHSSPGGRKSRWGKGERHRSMGCRWGRFGEVGSGWFRIIEEGPVVTC